MKPANSSNSCPPASHYLVAPAFGYLGLLLLPLAAVGGNALVVGAVASTRHLRTTTNFLIVSLAAADLLVGLTVMPFNIYTEMYHSIWLLPDYACQAYVVADVSCSTCSIANLVAISIDRFYAVVRHLEYRTPTHRRRTFFIILAAWVFSVGIGVPQGILLIVPPSINCDRCVIESTTFMLYGSIFAFYLPCTVMLIMYSFVFWKLHQQSKAVSTQKLSKLSQGSSIIPHTGHQNLSRILTSVHGDGKNVRHTFFGFAALPVVASPSGSSASETEYMDNYSSIANFTENGSAKLRDFGMTETAFSGPYRQNTTQSCPCDVYPVTQSTSQQTASRKISSNITGQILRMRRAVGVVKKLKKDRKQYTVRKEARATRLVASVMLVFLLCWAPFFTVNLIICGILNRGGVPSGSLMKIFTACTWLGYVNSAMNPIIYSLANNRFRSAFRKILCGCTPGKTMHTSRRIDRLRRV